MAAQSSKLITEGAIPISGSMDPQSADVIAKKPRRRKLRKQCEPWPDMAAKKGGLEARVRARPTHAMVMLEPAGKDREHFVPVHNDQRLHDLQLAEAFGTRSFPVITTFLRQLEELCGRGWWDEQAQQWRLDEPTFNTLLALISSVKPRNEMEAALAAQMAAIHLLTMKVTARAIRYDYDTKSSAAAGKLARTFTMQMDALRQLRGKNRTTRQSIKVTKELHQHVHYHGTRGGGDSGGQSHGRRERTAASDDECATLPSSDTGGRVVPLPRRARKA